MARIFNRTLLAAALVVTLAACGDSDDAANTTAVVQVDPSYAPYPNFETLQASTDVVIVGHVSGERTAHINEADPEDLSGLRREIGWIEFTIDQLIAGDHAEKTLEIQWPTYHVDKEGRRIERLEVLGIQFDAQKPQQQYVVMARRTDGGFVLNSPDGLLTVQADRTVQAYSTYGPAAELNGLPLETLQQRLQQQ